MASKSIEKKQASHFTNIILKSNTFINKRNDTWIKQESIAYIDKVLMENTNIKTYSATLADLYTKAYMTNGDKKVQYSEKEVRALNGLLLRIAMTHEICEYEEFFQIFNGVCDVHFERGLVLFVICMYQTNKHLEILLKYDSTVCCCRGHMAMIISFNEHSFDNVQTLLKYGSSDNYYYWHVLGNNAQKMLDAFRDQNILECSQINSLVKKYDLLKFDQKLNIAHVIELKILAESTINKVKNTISKQILNSRIKININVSVFTPTYKLLVKFFEEIMHYSVDVSHYDELMKDDEYCDHYKITKVSEPYLSPYDREVD